MPRPINRVTRYRPISVTPVLSRILEKLVVRRYVYPLLRQPSTALHFEDQFAFSPFGSTDAAIITLLYTLQLCARCWRPTTTCTSLRLTSQRRLTRSGTTRWWRRWRLWSYLTIGINDFFRDRQHCTRYAGQSSSVADITASIIQGSGLGPASYIITAADLQAPPRHERKSNRQVRWWYVYAPLSCTGLQLELAAPWNKPYPV